MAFQFDPYSQEEAGIQRKRELANALIQGAFNVPQGQTVSGHYIAPNFMQYIAPLAGAVRGNMMQSDIDTQEKQLGQRYQSDLADTLRKAQDQMTGQPGEYPPNYDPNMEGPQPGGQREIKPDYMGAMSTYLQHPATAQLGQDIMLENAKALAKRGMMGMSPGQTVVARINSNLQQNPNYVPTQADLNLAATDVDPNIAKWGQQMLGSIYGKEYEETTKARIAGRSELVDYKYTNENGDAITAQLPRGYAVQLGGRPPTAEGLAAYQAGGQTGIQPATTAPGMPAAPTQQTPIGGGPAINAIGQVETGGLPNRATAVSPKGAFGQFQIMPATAANPGYGMQPIDLKNTTPEQQGAWAEQYLQRIKDKYGFDDRQAIAAYNAGPGATDRAVQIAKQTGKDFLSLLPPETQAYVPKVAAANGGTVPQIGVNPAQQQRQQKLFETNVNDYSQMRNQLPTIQKNEAAVNEALRLLNEDLPNWKGGKAGQFLDMKARAQYELKNVLGTLTPADEKEYAAYEKLDRVLKLISLTNSAALIKGGQISDFERRLGAATQPGADVNRKALIDMLNEGKKQYSDWYGQYNDLGSQIGMNKKSGQDRFAGFSMGQAPTTETNRFGNYTLVK